MNFPIHSREFITFLLDSLQDGIMIVDGNGKLIYGNRAILKLLERDKESITNTPFPDFIQDKRLKAFFTLDGEKKEEEYTANGRHLLLKYFPYQGRDGIYNHIFTLRDITEIKDSQSQLLEEKMSLDMIEDLLAHAYEGFALVDKEGRIVKWNYHKL